MIINVLFVLISVNSISAALLTCLPGYDEHHFENKRYLDTLLQGFAEENYQLPTDYPCTFITEGNVVICDNLGSVDQSTSITAKNILVLGSLSGLGIHLNASETLCIYNIDPRPTMADLIRDNETPVVDRIDQLFECLANCRGVIRAGYTTMEAKNIVLIGASLVSKGDLVMEAKKDFIADSAAIDQVLIEGSERGGIPPITESGRIPSLWSRTTHYQTATVSWIMSKENISAMTRNLYSIGGRWAAGNKIIRSASPGNLISIPKNLETKVVTSIEETDDEGSDED